MCPAISRRGFIAGAGAAGVCLGGDVFGETPLVRFGIFTDAHYKDAVAASGLVYGGALARVRACAAAMNARRPDFTIELGDFGDTDSPGSAGHDRALGFLRAVEAEYAAFSGPRYHAIGNHDTGSLTKAEILGVFSQSGAATPGAYYSFTVNGVKFIVLDTNYMGEAESDSYGVYNWGGAQQTPYLSAVQLEWLDAQLAAATGHCIVFAHHRMDAQGRAQDVKTSIVNHGKTGEIFRRRGNVAFL